MKQKTAYAVFTTTDTGKEYMVKGNFGDDKESAEEWACKNALTISLRVGPPYPELYPNGLFVKEVKY